MLVFTKLIILGGMRGANILCDIGHQQRITLSGVCQLLSYEVVSGRGSTYTHFNLLVEGSVVDCKTWDRESRNKARALNNQMIVVTGSVQKGSLSYAGDCVFVKSVSPCIKTTHVMTTRDTRDRVCAQRTMDRIAQVIGAFENRVLADLVVSMIRDSMGEFSRCRGSSTTHHSYIGGLMLHSLETAEHAVAISRVVISTKENTIQPELVGVYREHIAGVDRAFHEIMVAGALIHDMGKMESVVNAVYPVWERKGDIVLRHAVTIKMYLENTPFIHRIRSEMNSEGNGDLFARMLVNIVMSHHSKYSPFFGGVECGSIEARVVRQADSTSSALCTNNVIMVYPDNGVVSINI
jgi:23S rRNA maturation-related 3'-5' exoribonuclease YhaM